MFKEMIICVIIFLSIISIDIFTQNFTQNTVDEITNIFVSLKDVIKVQNVQEINSKIDELNSLWNLKHDRLAYYIEHDELEKVDVAITRMKSYIQTNSYSEATAELEDGKFVLEHIQEKNAFNLKNIF